MVATLRALHDAGLDLRNGYVAGTLDITRHGPDGHPQSDRAAEAWAGLCQDITCVSVDARGPRDGCVRYDEPGSMHPVQHAELMFVPDGLASLAKGRYDPLAALERHADRLLIVQD